MKPLETPKEMALRLHPRLFLEDTERVAALAAIRERDGAIAAALESEAVYYEQNPHVAAALRAFARKLGGAS